MIEKDRRITGGFSDTLPTREHRLKVRLGQDASDLRALVTLNLDLAVLYRAAGAAGALHRLC